MNNPTWSSEAIRFSDALCMDVKASKGAVVLGLFIGNGELAVDVAIDADFAERVALALNTGAAESRA